MGRAPNAMDGALMGVEGTSLNACDGGAKLPPLPSPFASTSRCLLIPSGRTRPCRLMYRRHLRPAGANLPRRRHSWLIYQPSWLIYQTSWLIYRKPPPLNGRAGADSIGALAQAEQ